MPKAKKTISKKRTVNSSLKTARIVSRRKAPVKKDFLDMPMAESSQSVVSKPRPMGKLLFLVLVLIILAALVIKNKGLFVAAMVNGRPILRISLDRQLVSRYGPSLLEEMVNDEIINGAADKNGIKVSLDEINAEISKIETSLGGKANLDQALTAQGMTMSDLKVDVQRRLLVNKMIAGSVNVSDQEITDYLEKNRSSMTATDEAGLKQEALDALTSQKKSAATQKWFTDLKAKAKITKYL